MQKGIRRKTEEIENWRRNITSDINFIPTMGNLHNGHLKLISTAKNENSNVNLVSIFINPLQFDNNLDLENYPKTIEMILKSHLQMAQMSSSSQVMKIYIHQIVKILNF